MNVYEVRYDDFGSPEAVRECVQFVLCETLAQVANHFYEDFKSLEDFDLTSVRYVCTISQRVGEVEV